MRQSKKKKLKYQRREAKLSISIYDHCLIVTPLPYFVTTLMNRNVYAAKVFYKFLTFFFGFRDCLISLRSAHVFLQTVELVALHNKQVW